MKFGIEIEALWRGAAGQEPAQVQFQAHRYVNAQNYYLNFTANLETGSSPPRYRVSWPLTTEKGFWTVTIPGYTVNPVSCKINKRQQIVEVAKSWANADREGMSCNALIGRIFGHLGLGGDWQSVTSAWTSTIDSAAGNSSPGDLVFYRSPAHLSSSWSDANSQTNGGIAGHVAIRIDSGIVDTDCGTPNDMNVHQHSDLFPPLNVYPGRVPQNLPLDTKERSLEELDTLDAE